MRWQRWLALVLLLSLVVLAVLYGFMPQPVLVETAVAERKQLRVTLEAEGKTRVKDRYVISAPVAGVARRIQLDVGDPVSQGQIVAWLEPLHSQVLDPRSRAEAQARLAAAEAQLRMAQEDAQAASAAAEYARADLARLQR
ncbi:MAG: efflux transporter periplasmic adaptor subunit, partial [Candidatus Competibacteraceae bacterium]|nr:efflux transporter periplasmic adaptor subunit [Candidatus Competibacteraceae bacterium]